MGVYVGREIVIVAMPLHWIVMLMDIAQRINFRFVIRFVISFRHPLCFETSKESLHWRVVPVVASATHTLLDSIFL